jgi:hypothetical protein
VPASSLKPSPNPNLNGVRKRQGAVKDFLDLLVRYAIPYSDPLRRRHMRRAARALVTCSPWPGEQASADQIVQLALLRLLRLQHEAHRSALVGNFEATVLATRAAIETCIAGLYWLPLDDAGAQLTGANARSLSRLMSYLIETVSVPKATVDQAVLLLGEPRPGPSVRDMAEQVANEDDAPFAKALYFPLYVPLSELFVHANGVALLRHVTGDQLTDTPDRYWTRRSALNTIDTCTAYLAFAIARDKGQPTKPFRPYLHAHAARMFAPVVTMFVSYSRRMIKFSEVVKLPGSLAKLRSASATFSTRDSSEEREAYLTNTIRKLLSEYEFAVDNDLLDRMITLLAKGFAAESEPRPDG